MCCTRRIVLEGEEGIYTAVLKLYILLMHYQKQKIFMIKVLIVEDELIIAQDVIDILEKMNYDVMENAMDAEETFEILSRDTPDLILLDINVSGSRDGIEIAKEINIELTDKHFEVIEYLREQVQKGVGLTIRSVGKSGVVDIKGLYQLFTGISPFMANHICFTCGIDSNSHIESLTDGHYDLLFKTIEKIQKNFNTNTFQPMLIKSPSGEFKDYHSMILTVTLPDSLLKEYDDIIS